MNMTIGKSMGNGFAGNYAQQPDMVIRSMPIDESSEPVRFGDPVAISTDGTAIAVDSSTTAAGFIGVACSQVQSTRTMESMEGVYHPQDMAAIFVRGVISVNAQGSSSPVPGGAVYIRVANAVAPSVVGGFEAAADGTDTIQLPHAVWMSEADSQGVASIQLRSINLI